MASSDAAIRAERQRAYAMGGIVRILCSIRLVVLVLAAGEAFAHSDGAALAVAAVAAAPLSFVPTLNWNTRGPVYFRNGVLLSADLVVTLCVLYLMAGAPLIVAYGAATVALWGATTGMCVASLMALPLAVLVIPWSYLDDGWRAITGAIVACGAVFAMAWAGALLANGVRCAERAEAELARERAEHAASEERLRIARDLHDTVAGDLAGITLLATSLAARIESGDVSTATSALADSLEESVTVAHRHMRMALDELRTVSDLRVDLEALVARWASRGEAGATVRWAGPAESVPPRLAMHVLAVAGELLENVRKHAHAQQVTTDVVVTDGGGQVQVTVEDDGVGMGPRLAAPGHYGMQGIRERAEAAEGSAIWEAGEHGGTRVRVVLRDPDRTVALPGDVVVGARVA